MFLNLLGMGYSGPLKLKTPKLANFANFLLGGGGGCCGPTQTPSPNISGTFHFWGNRYFGPTLGCSGIFEHKIFSLKILSTQTASDWGLTILWYVCTLRTKAPLTENFHVEWWKFTCPLILPKTQRNHVSRLKTEFRIQLCNSELNVPGRETVLSQVEFGSLGTSRSLLM